MIYHFQSISFRFLYDHTHICQTLFRLMPLRNRESKSYVKQSAKYFENESQQNLTERKAILN